MTFDNFRYRYFLITKTEFRNQPSKCMQVIGKELYYRYSKILKNKPYMYGDTYAIVIDLVEREVLGIVETIDKSFEVNKDFFKFDKLNKFKVNNKIAYNQNHIRMSYIEGKILSTYAIDNVWMFIHYITIRNNERLLLNRNCFGNFSILETRDYKLYKLLNQ